MAPNENNDESSVVKGSLKDQDEAWQRKKKELLENLSNYSSDRNSGNQFDKTLIDNEIEALNKKTDDFEQTRHELSKKVKDLMLQLDLKKRESDKTEKNTAKLKKKLVKTRTIESSSINEIKFFESEKNRLSNQQQLNGKLFEENILSLDKSVKDIGFIRGETGSIINKMSDLEKEIPEQTSDVNSLDQTLAGTLNSLKDLYDKMQHMEKKFTASYYKNKRQAEAQSI